MQTETPDRTLTELPENADELQSWRKNVREAQYGVIRQAISPDTAAVADRYIRILHQYYEPMRHFDASQQSHGRYNDPMGESVLALVALQISRVTGLGAPQRNRAPQRSPPGVSAVGTPVAGPGRPESLQRTVRRNDPCPGGSGKRFGNCHGAMV